MLGKVRGVDNEEVRATQGQYMLFGKLAIWNLGHAGFL